ncbi:Stk1 family PASTA domain-containing Ser/Thr kinase [Cellulomonas sp.]|uniref:Stk1 family PASTA domain-containing Ser/Thr kinase n=1 Tax=Cellulomonas sp. TaxID=40001 RepID=UPI001B25AAB2|nr:Stk1 family PASTA domain-containing Ser/Thr kinase [Cellulomonas sp.]MBO9555861.1 Stk1 family PASTA domain-containing Ser/Thr kinase [Cellulomonas sp.]
MVDDGSRILAGRYEVGELIGRGGMAEVHIGHDTRLGRTVAIKILRSDLARDPSFQNRFRREAQSAAALNHPAIVSVYDTGEDVFTEPTGVVAHVPFIVMEYVEGHTVRDILRDGHAVPIEEAVEITAGVLSALEYSHHAGIVHRDIKPANVMLTPTGAVKVMDFGIARAVADSAATMTQTQAVIGTAQYLSPEQARGETVDARSDLYSTGCLLFELLTGRPPFTGDSPVAVAYQHVREAAPVPSTFASDVPDSLDRITLKALAKERDARYSTAAEFRSDLEAVIRGGTVAAPAVGAAVLAPVPNDATQVMGPPTTTTQTLPPSTPPWQTTGFGTVATSTAMGVEDEDERRRPWLMWVLIGIAVLAVAGIIALLVANANRNQTPTTVAVPTVVGLTEEQAKKAITDADLLYQRTEAASDKPKGEALSSDPAAGTQVEKESTVTVTISTGPATTTVPDVTGKSVDEAVSILEGKGFKVDPNQTQDNNGAFPAGQVTATNPAANSPVDTGATVTLSVSTGNVTVPNVVGKPQAEATQALNDANLQVNTTEVESPQPPGTVVAQDKAPDTLVKQRTVVNLQIAKAMTTATVPSVAGMTYDQAVQTLAQAGLTNVKRVDETSERPANEVLRTDPASGTEVEFDQQIDIHVSKGNQPQGNGTPTKNP